METSVVKERTLKSLFQSITACCCVQSFSCICSFVNKMLLGLEHEVTGRTRTKWCFARRLPLQLMTSRFNLTPPLSSLLQRHLSLLSSQNFRNERAFFNSLVNWPLTYWKQSSTIHGNTEENTYIESLLKAMVPLGKSLSSTLTMADRAWLLMRAWLPLIISVRSTWNWPARSGT